MVDGSPDAALQRSSLLDSDPCVRVIRLSARISATTSDDDRLAPQGIVFHSRLRLGRDRKLLGPLTDADGRRHVLVATRGGPAVG